MRTLILISLILSAGNLLAAKPIPETTIAAGPVMGAFSCDAANHSNQAIEVLFYWCESARDGSANVNCGTAEITLYPDRHYGVGNPDTLLSNLYTHTCEVSYQGNIGDVTATLCGAYGCLSLE